MKILLQEGTRYGWRDVALFPNDFFDDPIVGPQLLRMYNGRIVGGGALGDEITSKISGRLGFVVDLNDPTLQFDGVRTEFARPRTSPTTPIQWGETGSGGGGSWPTTGDRALMRKIYADYDMTLTQFNMRIKAGSLGVGDQFKGLVYLGDAAGGYPRTLIGVSSPTGATVGGAELLTAACSIFVPAGSFYWEGYVCNGASGPGSDTDSGGAETNVAIILNGGEVNYASPPAIAGLWPGSPGPYSNRPSIWFDGTY